MSRHARGGKTARQTILDLVITLGNMCRKPIIRGKADFFFWEAFDAGSRPAAIALK